MDSDLQVHILWENELQLNMESMHCAYSKPIHCVDCVVQGNIHTPPPPPTEGTFALDPSTTARKLPSWGCFSEIPPTPSPPEISVISQLD